MNDDIVNETGFNETQLNTLARMVADMTSAISKEVKVAFDKNTESIMELKSTYDANARLMGAAYIYGATPRLSTEESVDRLKTIERLLKK